MKKGWEVKKLGDVAYTISTGPFGSVLHKSDYVSQGVPLVNPINIVDEKIIPDPTKLISDITKARLSNYVLQEGDIVVGRRGEIGRCAIVGPNEAGWVCGTGSFFIRPLPIVSSHFIAQLIRSSVYRDKLEQASTGATMKNLSNTALAELLIPVPPLPEQQRIVGVLDEAFASLAIAQANTEKNRQNARALFESHLQSIFTQRGEGWVEKTLADVADLIDCLHKTPTYVDSGFPMVRVTDIKPGCLDLSKTRKVDEKTYIEFSKKHRPKPGDIVFSRVGSCGVSALVNSDEPFCLGQNTVFILPRVEPMFLYMFMNSQNAKDQINRRIEGTTQPTISLKSIRGISVSIPPYEDRASLIEKFVGLESETQRLEGIYQRKLEALAALKKSLLQQAFSGQL